MTSIIEIITALGDAQQLIADPEAWSPDGPEYERDDNKMCALDALGEATDGTSTWSAAYRALVAVVPQPYCNVGTFNDADETTHEDVMDLFDRAILTVKETWT